MGIIYIRDCIVHSSPSGITSQEPSIWLYSHLTNACPVYAVKLGYRDGRCQNTNARADTCRYRMQTDRWFIYRCNGTKIKMVYKSCYMLYSPERDERDRLWTYIGCTTNYCTMAVTMATTTTRGLQRRLIIQQYVHIYTQLKN